MQGRVFGKMFREIGKTEFSVYLRCRKLLPFSCEPKSLNLIRATSILKFNANSCRFQTILKLLECIDALVVPCIVDGVENLIPCLFIASEFVDFCLRFALGNMEPILFGQIKTNLPVAVKIVLVRDCFAVIIDAAEHKVAVWIILVKMADDDKRCVNYAHSFHIFPGNLYHHTVVNLVLIVGVKIQREVADHIFP